MGSAVFWIGMAVIAAAVVWLLFRSRGGNPAELMAALGNDPLIVDVRTPGEFGQGHVDGARNVPVGALAGVVDDLTDKERSVVLYCRSGGRSAQAARIFRAAGYTAVVDGGAMSNVTAALQGADES